jgi:type IV pilus assembly protein PilX
MRSSGRFLRLSRNGIAGRQRGAALVVALLFLVILAMLGVSAMTSTTLEERMAGNARDQNIAIQAAEAALRDAERDLTNSNPAFRVIQTANFVASCAQALCTEGALLANLDDATKSAFYGQYSGALAVPGTVQQPRYMLELLAAVPPQVPPPPPGQTIRNFRVTAKGFGQNANTIVILQTVFQMTL